MTAPALPVAAIDPAGYVLAVAYLRETRWQAATPGPYKALSLHTIDGVDWHVHAGLNGAVWLYVGGGEQDRADAVHIAAEANPAHARTEIALWRGVAGRHAPIEWPPGDRPIRIVCVYCSAGQAVPAFYPCADLALVVAAARAYLTGTGG